MHTVGFRISELSERGGRLVFSAGGKVKKLLKRDKAAKALHTRLDAQVFFPDDSILHTSGLLITALVGSASRAATC